MLAVAIQPVLFSGYPLHVTFDSASTTGFPGGTVVKNPPANAEDTNSTPGSGRSSEEGNGNPVQYSCLGNSMDRGAWWAIVHGAARVRHSLVTKPPLPINTQVIRV